MIICVLVRMTIPLFRFWCAGSATVLLRRAKHACATGTTQLSPSMSLRPSVAGWVRHARRREEIRDRFKTVSLNTVGDEREKIDDG